jgi:choice-of-anchor C domain-containing protein
MLDRPINQTANQLRKGVEVLHKNLPAAVARVSVMLCLATVVIVTTAREGQANLVLNGDFELPSIAGNPYLQSPPDTTITNWTISGGNVDLINYYWMAGHLTQSVDLDGTQPGAITQVLPTVPGQLYNLSFAFSNNPDGGPGQNFNGQPTSFPASAQVTAVGNSLLLQQDIWHDQTAPGNFPRANSRTDMNWDVANYTFRADSSSTTLTFASLDINFSPWGIALDNVSVQPNTVNPAVPEPASLVVWSLLAGGSAGLAVARRRRRGPGPRWSRQNREEILSVIAGRSEQ